MRGRADAFVTLIASATSLLLIGFVAFVLYPRLTRWLGPEQPAVVGTAPSPTDAVPVWVCHGVEGVGLMLRAGLDEGAGNGIGEALAGGPYQFLTLHVYNFAREEPFDLALPAAGFASPEGGEPARPVASLVRSDAPDHLRPILLGLGAVPTLSVPRGHSAQALLAVRGDPARRTGFVSGDLRFERRELERWRLARWQLRPDAREFEDF